MAMITKLRECGRELQSDSYRSFTCPTADTTPRVTTALSVATARLRGRGKRNKSASQDAARRSHRKRALEWQKCGYEKKKKTKEETGEELARANCRIRGRKRCGPEEDRRHAQRDFFSKSMGPASSMRQESKSGSCADSPENNNNWKWKAGR